MRRIIVNWPCQLMGTTYSASWNAWISSSAGVEWNVARVPPLLPLLPWWPPGYWLTNCRLALTGSTPYHPPNSWFTWTIRQCTAQSYMSILAFFLTYLTLSTSNSWLILKLKIEICLIKSNILVTPERSEDNGMSSAVHSAVSSRGGGRQ